MSKYLPARNNHSLFSAQTTALTFTLSWTLTLAVPNGRKSPHNLPKFGFLYITLAHLPQ